MAINSEALSFCAGGSILFQYETQSVCKKQSSLKEYFLDVLHTIAWVQGLNVIFKIDHTLLGFTLLVSCLQCIWSYYSNEMLKCDQGL